MRPRKRTTGKLKADFPEEESVLDEYQMVARTRQAPNFHSFQKDLKVLQEFASNPQKRITILPEDNRRKILKWVYFSLLGVILIGLIYLYGKLVVESLFDLLFLIFDQVYYFSEPWRSFFLIISSFTIQVLGIPIATVLIMIVSYCMASIFIGFLYSMVITIATNTVFYYGIKKAAQIKNRQTPESEGRQDSHESSKLLDDKPLSFVDFLFVFLREYTKTHPYAFGFLVRTLHVPDYIKVYFVVTFGGSYSDMLVSVLVIDSLNDLLFSFIGSQLKNKFDLLSAKSFNEKSLAEKIGAITAIILVIMQLVIFTSGLIYTRRKYKEYQESTKKVFTNSEINHRMSILEDDTSFEVSPGPKVPFPSSSVSRKVSNNILPLEVQLSESLTMQQSKFTESTMDGTKVGFGSADKTISIFQPAGSDFNFPGQP